MGSGRTENCSSSLVRTCCLSLAPLILALPVTKANSDVHLAMGDIAVSTLALISRGRSVHGWPSGHQVDSEEAIAFAETMGIKCLVQPYPLGKAQNALEDMLANKVRFRAVLKIT